MRFFKKLWFKLFPHDVFPHDEWTDVHPETYYAADRLIRITEGCSEKEKWRICPHFEDRNRVIGVVWIGKRRRNGE